MAKSVKLTGDETIAMHHDMFAWLGTIRKIPLELQDIIGENTEIIRFDKKYILLLFQKTCTHCYFIVKGRLKVYEVNDKGKENIIWLLKEEDVVTAPVSFITQTPSMEAIQALEETICIILPYEAMINIRNKFPEFNDIYIQLTEIYYQRKCKKDKLLLLEDPEERYNLFMKEEPELCRRCSGKDIAAYLGIARETLSRIRNKR